MPRNDKLSNYRTTWHSTTDGGAVTYIRTEIVRWDANRNVTLNSGGWRTVTTKRKMVQASNQFNLGYTVHQSKGDWFVTVFGVSPEGYDSASAEHGAITFPYYDGITFNAFDILAGKTSVVLA
jgi:hypothetical protein